MSSAGFSGARIKPSYVKGVDHDPSLLIVHINQEVFSYLKLKQQLKSFPSCPSMRMSAHLSQIAPLWPIPLVDMQMMEPRICASRVLELQVKSYLISPSLSPLRKFGFP